jgi:glycosyltransferase involved in cell wall biosynthesis
VITVHDLIFRENRGSTLRQQLGRRWMAFAVPRAARAADALITVGQEVADELIAAGYPTPTVIPHGIRDVADEPGPSEPYFVVFGGADPRKNLTLALDAFARAQEALAGTVRLVVLAGAGLSPADEQRARRIPGVEIRPFLPAEEVAGLLRRARALIHPSTREGFGLPLLEAFAAGTPAIGGLTAVARRIGGPALLRIDPADPVVSLADLVIRLGQDPAAAQASARAGLARAREFSWRTCAERHVDVYTAALRARG